MGWQTGDDLTFYIQQMQSIYKVPVSGAATSVSVPGMMPYVTSGQLTGFIAGLKGAAEYEQAIKSPGLASSGMDAQSLSHLLVMFFILLGNIAYLSSRLTGKKVG
jgi:ABC-type nitrate/sulfonate/bicarbonate transport system permease component